MNCKPGDLALVVRSIAGNEGIIVRCVRLIPKPYWAFMPGPRWKIDSFLRDNFGLPIDSLADSCLRPIRGQEGEDETLSWKEVPLPTVPAVADARALIRKVAA